MHKLIEYICDELEDLERKAEKDGKLSMAEVQYGDMLAHFKKNLLKAEEMTEDGYSEDRYSMRDGGNYRGGNYSNRGGYSYARNRRRDSMGRYSMDSDEMVTELRSLMREAPDDRTRKEFERFISKIESM